MARSRRSRRSLDELAEEEEIAARPRRFRRLRWLVPLALLGLVALVAAAPTIVGKTPLVNRLLAGALPAEAASLRCQGASLSWTGEQQLLGVTLLDGQGTQLATADAISVRQSLLSLASDARRVGKIVVVRPTVQLDLRPGGSNLQDFAAKLAERLAARAAAPPAPGADADAGPPFAELEIVDGTILGRDAASGRQWRLNELAATVKPDAVLANWDVAGAAALADDAAPQDAGRFKFALRPGDGGRRHVELIGDRLPLAPLQPLVAGSLAAAQLTGRASVDLRGDGALSAGGAPQGTVAGRIEGSDIQFTAAALQGDQLQLASVVVQLDAGLDGATIAARQLELRSDWCQAELTGEVDLTDLPRIAVGQFPQRDASLTARANLPQLAAQLPRTLRLRPGVRFDAGVLDVTLKGAQRDGARRWTIAGVVDQLAGEGAGRPIRWTEPVEAGVDVAAYAAGAEIERIILRTPFAAVSAEVEGAGFAGTVDFNLNKLQRELGQFVDLAAWQLAGAGRGKFSVRPDGQRFLASADLDLADVDLRRAGKPVWIDPQLRLEVRAGGLREGLRPVRFDDGKLALRGPADGAVVTLSEPFAPGIADQNVAVRIDAEGPLPSWAGRLRPWVAGVPEVLDGSAKLAADVRARAGYVEASNLEASVDQFRLQTASLAVSEPRIEATGDLRWDAANSALDARDLQISSSSASTRARDVSIRLGGGAPTVFRGDVAFRADLARLAAWAPAAAEADWRPRGQAVGRLKLAHDAALATAHLEATVEPFKLSRRGPVQSGGAATRAAAGAAASAAASAAAEPRTGFVVWEEPRLQLEADAQYDPQADQLRVPTARVKGSTLEVAAAATVDRLQTVGDLRAEANVGYDAAALAQLLASYLGPNVRLDGANQAKVRVAGQLRPGGIPALPAAVAIAPSADAAAHWSRVWQASTQAGWSQGNVFGAPLGAASLNASLGEGELHFEPVTVALGAGTLTAQPRIVFDPAPTQLLLAPGPLGTRLAVSQEMSELMLKYAAPILAGATRSEGEFSVALDGLQLPLAQPKQSRGGGRLTVHRLSIMPGPLVQDLATVVARIDALGKGQPLAAAAPAPALRGVTMTEQTVDVQVTDGRVYHRNLQFLIDDVPVRSYGSVGFDESLALMIEVPIQQKWVGNRRALQQMVGQMIQIPVQGTLNKPRLDERAVAQLSTQLLQNAAAGVIGEELKGALDRLFKPRQ